MENEFEILEFNDNNQPKIEETPVVVQFHTLFR